MSKLAKIPLVIAGAGAGFFVVTFTIYFFNLDMKATAMVEPFFEKWYNHLERNTYL